MPSSALITGDIEVFLCLLVIVSGLIWASSLNIFAKIFKAIPVIIWIVLTAAALTNFSVFPKDSSLYLTIGKLCLPLSLFFLIASCDLAALTKVGKNAAIAALGGTLGVALGGIIVVFVFSRGENAHLWQGFSVIAAGWIGGTANGAAVQQGLQAPPETIAPMIVMQTFSGFAWLLFLLSLARHQNWLQMLYSRRKAIPMPLSQGTHTLKEREDKPFSLQSLSLLATAGIGALIVAGAGAELLPELGNPVIVSHATWVILIVSGLAMVATMSKEVKDVSEQSSTLGYYCLYLMLATLGTQLSFTALDNIGVYAIAGVMWMAIHFITLLLIARIFGLPAPFVAIGSMSNIGGIVTAPLVASYYDKRLTPVALLMAVGTQIIGVYLPFALAGIFSFIAGM